MRIDVFFYENAMTRTNDPHLPTLSRSFPLSLSLSLSLSLALSLSLVLSLQEFVVRKKRIKINKLTTTQKVCVCV